MTINRIKFTEDEIEAVWQKALIQPNNNPDIFRKDYAGAWICKTSYGKKTEYGWDIDFVKPLSKGGTNELSNLEPLQWENRNSKNDDYPEWKTIKSSEDIHNVDMERFWRIKNL